MRKYVLIFYYYKTFFGISETYIMSTNVNFLLLLNIICGELFNFLALNEVCQCPFAKHTFSEIQMIIGVLN